MEKKVMLAKKFNNVSVKDCDINNLVNLNSIKVNEKLPKPLRILDYMNQIENPYLFKVGNVAVKISFNEKGESLQSLMENLISNG